MNEETSRIILMFIIGIAIICFFSLVIFVGLKVATSFNNLECIEMAESPFFIENYGKNS